MKNLFKFFGIIALVAIIGSMTACDSGGGGGSKSGNTGNNGNSGNNGSGNPFIGTWTGTDTDGDRMQIVITSSSWTASWLDTEYGPFTGTYTYSGNTATFTVIGEGVVGTASVSGNTMTGFLTSLGFGFTVSKGSGNSGGGNPFIGTWTGTDGDGDSMRVVVTSSSWTASWPTTPDFGPYSGTYTYSGNTATLKIYDDVVGSATVSGNTMTGIMYFDDYDTLTFNLSK